MRVLVCGGRHFANSALLYKALDLLLSKRPVTVVIHGAASGADTLAGQWASDRSIVVDAYPAQWRKHGKAAGPIRNALMLRRGQPDIVVAFAGGRGTSNMIRLAKEAGVDVWNLARHGS